MFCLGKNKSYLNKANHSHIEGNFNFIMQDDADTSLHEKYRLN